MDKEKLIDGFFEASLAPDQMEVMQDLLTTDADFAAEVEFQKDLQQALKKKERLEIKKEFASLSPKKEPKVIPMRSFWIAASFVAILGFSYFFSQINTINSNDLYAQNFEVYENVIHPIERAGMSEDAMFKAFYAYENGNYKDALQLFAALDAKQDNADINFYKALVYMQLGDQKSAIPLLEKYSTANGFLKDRALWYLSLAHLKLENIEQAKIELNKLITNGDFKKKAAQKLLKALS